VVDEAARCTASELAVPLQAAKWVVLVGDHFQLKPLHHKAVIEQVADELRIGTGEIVRSDFERVFETSYGRAAGHTLKRQYRMLPPIGRIVSESFYGGALDHGREVPVIPPEALPGDLDHPVTWIDTGPLGERGRQSDPTRLMSLSNVAEADCIVALLKRWSDCPRFLEWLASDNQYAHGIGLICSYAAQRDLLRRKINGAPIAPALRSALKVDTIDSYQGKENPIVIVSLVRNNWDGRMEDGVATIQPGFLSEPNRINVAISRAMDRLLIVGCKSRWPRSSPMASISNSFRREEERGEALAIDAGTFLDQAAERSLEHIEEPQL
jgi:superfamily I DNA and/or RNA helicase